MNKSDSLIQESPDAIRFVENVVQSSQQYKRFPSESFTTVESGVLLTSGVDLQGEAFAQEALEEAVRHIREHGLWLRYQHDPMVPPIGRVLDADLFYAPRSKLSFVAGVFGIFDPKSIPSFSSFRIAVPDADQTKGPPEESEPPILAVTVEYNPHEIAREDVTQMLQSAPDSVSRQPVEQFRKAADPLTLVYLVIASWPLWANPFSMKFLERFGEEAANGVIALAKWLGKKVASKLRSDSRLVFKFTTQNCELEFVLDSNDPAIVSEAARKVLETWEQANQLISALAGYELQRLVYEYDRNAKQWLPSFAETKKVGLIADRPKLIAAEAFQSGGLSVGGRREASIDQQSLTEKSNTKLLRNGQSKEADDESRRG